MKYILTAFFALISIFQTSAARAQAEARPDTSYASVVQYQLSTWNPKSFGALKLAGLGIAAEATITCKEYPSFSEKVFVPADSFYTYKLPGWLMNVIGEVDEVSDRALLVNATSPIMVFQYMDGIDNTFSPSGYFAGLEHRIISYPNAGYLTTKPPIHRVGSYCVCATEDSTYLSIRNSERSLSGLPADSLLIVKIDRGQCYSMMVDSLIPYADFTGSHILSNRRVHVISTRGVLLIPADSAAHLYRGMGGYAIEHLPPVERWQRAIIAGGLFTGDSADLTRILAAEDNTQLYSGGEPFGQQLNAGQFVDLFIKASEPKLITSNNPILAAIFTRSPINNSDPPDTSRATAMCLAPFLEDLNNDYTVYLQEGADEHYVQWHAVRIYADMDALSTLKVDGVPVSASQFTEVGEWSGRRFAIATVILTGGVHRITSEVSSRYGFAVIAYGRSFNGVGYAYTLSKMYLPWHERTNAVVGMSTSDRHVPSIISNGNIVTLNVDLQKTGDGDYGVFDLSGKLVASDRLGFMPAGQNSIRIPLELSSGTYWIRLEVGSQTFITKLSHVH